MKDLYSKNEEIIIETIPGNYEKIVSTMQKSGIKNIYKRDNNLVVYTPNADSTLMLILRIVGMLGEKLVELEVNKPTLNEIFETMIGKNNKIDGTKRLHADIDNSISKFKQSELRTELLKQYPKELVDEALEQR